ncbi:hypothetical protein GLAREA_13057 [Glarea lozoyensis ATCC 20868]|uniref:DUF5597 domain-containing protein n=1 Tax=Glarea lozoyensis (strain ATCC 20868 / MF5171) TaxID=1116229 RepID=S3CZM1_GLAL2|nr:uncharacterized protein GLAREA_13057 [Glarea lozoyensis ATCC 20868]EPE30334.1 hypothetical protein GLAREA_13057 [Glarea lozoyensis ATCC 20868]
MEVQVPCTHNRPRKKRGPRNRYVLALAEAGMVSSRGDDFPSPASTSTLAAVVSHSFSIIVSSILDKIAPTTVIRHIIDDCARLDIRGLSPIIGGGSKPGDYPSRGAVPHAFDIWKYNTSSFDFIAPDLYFNDHEKVCEKYQHGDQPLFIPEQRHDDQGARRVWLAIGTYLGIGTSPFGIDSLEAEESPITKHYRLLNSMSEHILDVQANRPEDIMGFFSDELEIIVDEPKWGSTFGEFKVTVERSFVCGKLSLGAGILIHQGDGKLLLLG